MTKLQPRKCYTDQVPIPEKKKSDLISILNLLPPSYHSFYLGLKSSAKIPDVLPDIEEFADEWTVFTCIHVLLHLTIEEYNVSNLLI